MAKRMKFSVVGLPHYTIWHLYEPSVDDIHHMEEMERERLAREAEEQAKADRAKRIKEQFADPNAQWDADKAAAAEAAEAGSVGGLGKVSHEAVNAVGGAPVQAAPQVADANGDKVPTAAEVIAAQQAAKAAKAKQGVSEHELKGMT